MTEEPKEMPKEMVNFIARNRPFKNKTNAELADLTLKAQVNLHVCVYEWEKRVGKVRKND